MIEILTLGQCGVCSDGESVPLRSRRGTALLVYLACQSGETVRREHLSDLFWQHSDRSRARHSLSQALYSLRQCLPDLPIKADNDALHLDLSAVQVDVLELFSALHQNSLDDVVNMYRGEFLEGFWLDNAPEFEHWQENKRLSVRRSVFRALLRGINKAEQSGRWPQAERLARAILKIDSLNEAAWNSLLTTMAAAGDRSAALAEFESMCSQFSISERTPPAELTALAEQLADSSVGSQPDADGWDELQAEIPFTGRDQEFQALRTYWEEITTKNGRMLFVIGEAGIGKTRFCQHFLRLAVLQNARIFLGRCYAAENRLPYGAVADALADGLREEDIMNLNPAWSSALAELVPEILPDAIQRRPSEPGEGARRRLFETIARVFEEISRQNPIVLFLDDFHWSDESTTEMVHYLGRRVRECPVLILLALRGEDVPSNSKISDMLRAINTKEHLRGIELKPLTDDAADQLISAFIDSNEFQLSNTAINQIVDQTAGRPFFILEILRSIERGEIDTKLLDHATGAIRPTVLLPSSVEALLASRIASLGQNARDIIGVLSVLGTDSYPKLIRRVGTFSTKHFFRGVDELVNRRMLSDSGSVLEFTHDLIREAAYRSLSTVLRRELHARAAEAIRSEKPERTGTVAVHYDLAGNSEAAFVSCLEAATATERMHADNETEYFLRKALANAPSDEKKYAVEERLAELLYRRRKFTESRNYFVRLESYYQSNSNAVGLLRSRFKQTIIAYIKNEFPPEIIADSLLDLKRTADDLDEVEILNEILIWSAGLGHFICRQDLALGSARQLIEISTKTENPAISARSLTYASTLIGLWDNLDKAGELAEKAIAFAQTSGHKEILINALKAKAFNYAQRGYLSEAFKKLQQILSMSRKEAILEGRHLTLNGLGIVLMDQGKYESALQILTEAIRFADVSEANLERFALNDNLAVLYYELGRYDEAIQLSGATIQAAKSSSWFSVVSASSMLGLCALARGHFAAAKQHRRDVDTRSGGRNLWTTDASYIEMFIARMSEQAGEAEKAIDRLGEAIAAYENRDVLCRSRMRIERARLRIKADPAAAKEEAEEVRQQAAEWGARPLVDKADRVLDRLALHAREGR